jgi:hypothetical protein
MIARWLARLQFWVRNETRLISLDSWADGAYAGPTEPHPCSAADPKCAALIERQAAVRARMKRMKAGILDGKPITRGADLAATFAAVRRVSEPPVRLLKRGAK